MSGYEVVTEALQAESAKWTDLADSMGAVAASVGGLGLDPSAFFCGDFNMMTHYQGYQNFQEYMEALLSQGREEFSQISNALLDVKRGYEEAEDVIDGDLNEIFSVQGE
jgi:endonuclease/exonuclease/phosphatase family metal-dependent hydrolase